MSRPAYAARPDSFFHAPKTVDTWPPDYVNAFGWRQKQLLMFKDSPEKLAEAKAYYKTRPESFINHWMSTYDPRKAGSGKLTTMPFILFERQGEFVTFLYELMKAGESGLVEKSRDMGATWICCSFSVWLWLFTSGASIGWGSRKSDLVDKIGDPDSIFEKLRVSILKLPKVFWPIGFNRDAHMSFMKIINPENGSTITGESGDNIGRGGRSLIYFKDEAAHYEHPEKIEAALSDNTNVQVDISSVNGVGNVFHRRREAGVLWEKGQRRPVRGKVNVFVLDWTEHPEKTQEWYDARKERSISDGLEHIFAQEVDRNYAASVEGTIISDVWVKAAIDAHIKLGLDDSGGWGAALDVADEGGDRNAFAKRKGIVLKSVKEWGARDVGVTTRYAIQECDGTRPIEVQYDCIGVGASVKAEINRLSDDDAPRGPMHGIRFVPWNAASSPLFPDQRVIEDDRDSPINKDYYQNLKAQGWWQLRLRFERTWRAIRKMAPDATELEKKFTYDPSELISLPSNLPLLHQTIKELIQPVMVKSSSLKMMVDKAPEGMRSPNCGDAIMMAYWPADAIRPMVISDSAIRNVQRMRYAFN